MKRLLLLALSAILVLAFTPVAMAQVVPDDGDPLTLENSCEGIVSQADYEACVAEQEAAGNPGYTDTDPQVGDTCPEGYAAFGDPGTGQLTCIPPDDPAIAQYSEETSAPTEAPSASESYTALPDTGGPALLMPVAALLIGAGILGVAILRRR